VSAGLAAAFDASSIAQAKLRAASGGGFPCTLEGSVTMHMGTTEFYLQDNTSGVRVASDPYLLKDGERLEVSGCIYLSDSGEFQVRARQVWHAAEGVPLRPRLVPLESALKGEYQGQLISVRGTVLDVNFANDFDTISIQSGRSSLRIFAPANPHGRSVFEPIYPGMQVAANGISVPQTADPEFDGYQLRLREPKDLAIRQGRLQPVSESGTSLASLALAAAVFGIWILLRARHRRTPSASLISPQVQ